MVRLTLAVIIPEFKGTIVANNGAGANIGTVQLKSGRVMTTNGAFTTLLYS
jgi:hypothetical protein